MARRMDWWVRQVYLAIIPSYPIGYLLVHGIRGDQVWTRMYVDRSIYKPSEQLMDLVESELDKLDGLKNGKVNVFLSDCAEPKVYGGFFLRSGAELQFPMRVSFHDVEQARRLAQNVELDLGLARNRRKIELNSKVGEELISRMLLSDAAKMFIVQRQLQTASSGVIFCAPVIAWLGIFSGGYPIMLGISSVVGMFSGALVSIILSASIFKQFYNSYDRWRIKCADEKTVERGYEYLRGAREYFTSTMQFNRLLRVVLGEDGEQYISKNGDVRTDPIPLSARLKNVETYWKRKATEAKCLN